jgi:nucleoid-associated protein YgaU
MASAEGAASPSAATEVGEQASAASPDAGQPATTAEGSAAEGSAAEGSAEETQVAAAAGAEAEAGMQQPGSAGAEAAAETPATPSADEMTVAEKSEPMAEGSDMAAQPPADSDEQPAETVAGATTGPETGQDGEKTMEMAAASTGEQASETMTETADAVEETPETPMTGTDMAASATDGTAMQGAEDEPEQAVAMAPAGEDQAAPSAAAPEMAEAGSGVEEPRQADRSEEPAEMETEVATNASGDTETTPDETAPDASEVAENGTVATQVEQAEASQPGQEMAAKTEPEPVAEEPKREYRLALEAVETEGNMVYAAGTGNPGTVVRVYADDAYVGETATNDDGRWLLETEAEIAAGNVVVRADELEEGSADVVRRAEVPFFKQADAIALLPTTAKAGAGAGEDAAGGELLAPRSVIIRSGDNLWTISRRTYGRGIRYTTIYQANNDQIRDPHMIFPGQVFVLPEGDTAWTQ